MALVSLVAFFSLLYFASSYRILYSAVSNITSDPGQHPQGISLPYKAPSAFSRGKVPPADAKQYRFNIHAIGYPFQKMQWHVVPNGCITSVSINDEKVDISGGDNGLLCDPARGFFIDLSKQAKSGLNLIEITLSDVQGGEYGLNIRPVFSLLGYDLYNQPNLFLIIAIWLYAAFVYKSGFGRVITVISSYAMYTYCFYFNAIPFTLSPDWWGHKQYINFINDHWFPPPSHMGWETYHPPLYYYASAIVGRMMPLFNLPFAEGSRYVTLVSAAVFNIYGMLFLRRAIRPYWLQLIAICTLLFWPLLVYLTGRITNEVMSYVFWAAAYYHMLKWVQDKDKKDYIYTLVICGLMMLCKTSALVPIGNLGIITLLDLWKQRTRFSYYFCKPIIFAGLFVVLCTAAVFGRTVYYKEKHAPHMGYVISNIYKDPIYHSVRAKATWKNMTHVDIDNLLNIPYVGLLNNEEGRQLFWVSYIKTISFGYKRHPFPKWAIRINVGLALLMAYAAIAPLLVWRLTPVHTYLYVSMLFCIISQIVTRITSATTVTADGRLTYPILILLIGWTAHVIQTLFERRQHFTGLVGTAILSWLCFCVIWHTMLYNNTHRLLKLLFGL